MATTSALLMQTQGKYKGLNVFNLKEGKTTQYANLEFYVPESVSGIRLPLEAVISGKRANLTVLEEVDAARALEAKFGLKVDSNYHLIVEASASTGTTRSGSSYPQLSFKVVDAKPFEGQLK